MRALSFALLLAIVPTTALANAGDDADSGSCTPGEVTCSSEFRDSEEYAVLPDHVQSRLREACNAWKLRALEEGLR